MARPAKFDRKEALITAMGAIWKDGFEQSSVKTLSELLGITRSSFYNAFGTREALFREALAEYAARSPDAALRSEPQTSVLALINEVFRNICRWHANDAQGRGCMIINSVCELCPDEDGLGAELTELVLGSLDRLNDLLGIAQKNGELSLNADTRAMALSLQGLMAGLSVMGKVVKQEDELWLLARTTLHGLGLYLEPANA